MPAIIEPPLSEHQLRTLLVLARRAIANSQLVLHEQALDDGGTETEEGGSFAAEDWPVELDEVCFEDGTAPRLAVHLYIPEGDIAALCGEEA